MDNRPMDDRELLAILREEERDASSFYSSELAHDQAEAMERYYGKPYGDEVEGRSKVVTHDVEDAINWMMPHLMRLFISNDELVTVEDEESDDAEEGDIAGEYLSQLFFKDNPGEEILHDFAFDGLLQRVGVVRVSWEEPQPSPPRTIRNIPVERLAEYVDNPEYEILSQSSDDAETMWDLEVRHTPPNGRPIIEQVPPEEFAYSKRTKSIAEADYHRRKTEEFVADLKRMFPDKARDLDPENRAFSSVNGEDELDDDPRSIVRHQTETDDVNSTESYHARRRKVELLTEYIRIDYDGDGVVELRQIKRVGNIILENVEVEKSEYIAWSPIRVAHKLTGRSVADLIVDIQKIRTVITRKMLDSLGQSLAPRRVVNKNRLGEDGIDQLLDHDIGDVIEVDGDPRESIHELITPDISGSAYQALEYFDTRAEEASGVTRHAQGLRAEAITDTAKGIESLQAAANSRIELVGRWLGHAVERIFERLFDLVQAHQAQPMIRRIRGQPMEINPSLWSDKAKVSIHIGQAAETREAKLSKLNIIASKQEQILMEAGPGNPIVSLQQYRETLALMAREAGFKKPGRFFAEIPPDYQPPDPQQQPDPKVLEAEAKIKLEQAKAQTQAQLDQAKMQAEQAMNAARLEADQEIARLRFEHERMMDEARMANEQEIAAMRIESESRIAFARMEAEQELARWRTQQEMELAKSKAADEAKMREDRPGGRLDA